MMSFLTLKTETTDRQSRINERSSSGKQYLKGFANKFYTKVASMASAVQSNLNAPKESEEDSEHGSSSKEQDSQTSGANLDEMLLGDEVPQI